MKNDNFHICTDIPQAIYLLIILIYRVNLMHPCIMFRRLRAKGEGETASRVSLISNTIFRLITYQAFQIIYLSILTIGWCHDHSTISQHFISKVGVVFHRVFMLLSLNFICVHTSLGVSNEYRKRSIGLKC